MNVYDFDKTIYNGDSTLDFYFFCLKKIYYCCDIFLFKFMDSYYTNLDFVIKLSLRNIFIAFLKGLMI